MEEEFNHLHEALSILVTPADKDKGVSLDVVLEDKIERAGKELSWTSLHELKTLQKSNIVVLPENSVGWRFTCAILHILLSLRECLTTFSEKVGREEVVGQPPPTVGLLSINQRKNIQKGLQFVIRLGLLPNLLPGVGIPVEARSLTVDDVEKQLNEKIPIMESYRRLVGVTTVLLKLMENPDLRGLVVINHLGDILAGLLQLTSAPLKKPVGPGGDAIGQEAKSSISDFVMTQKLWEELQKDRQRFTHLLNSLVEDSYQPLVMKELLLLQSVSRPSRVDRKCTRPPPMWLRKACSNLLTSCVLKPDGLSSLVRVICDLSADSGRDWTKQDVIARLIANMCEVLPEKCSRFICPQIIDLLNLEDVVSNQQYIEVARMCMKTVSEKNSKMFQDDLLNQIMLPLLKCTTVPPSTQETKVVVCEKEMELCVRCLHRCFVAKSDLSALPVKWLLPAASILFKLFAFVHNSASYLKNNIEHLLTKLLSSSDNYFREKLFCVWLFHENTSMVFEFHSELEFAFGPSGGVKVVFKEPNKDLTEEETFLSSLSDEHQTASFLYLLETDKSGDILYTSFIFLFKRLSESVRGEIVLPEDDIARLDALQKFSRHQSQTVKLLSSLIENPLIQENMEKNPTAMVQMLEVLLKNAVDNMNTENTSGDYTDNVFLSLVALSLLVVESKLTSDTWDALQTLVNPLKVLLDKAVDKNVQFLAEELCESILTRGVYSRNKSSASREKYSKFAREHNLKEDHNREDNELKVKSKASTLDKTTTSSSVASTKRTTSKSGDCRTVDVEAEVSKKDIKRETEGKISKFKEVVFNLFDPMLPVRGHALLELSKLVAQKDEETLSEKETVLRMFQENIDHSDSYIYLMSVKGLAAMADVFPDYVIEVLCDEYMEIRIKRQKNPEDMAHFTYLRLKIGEVLLQVTKSLGEMAPKYKTPLLDAFLVGTRDPDHLVRASSLSNLGEICRVLRFEIGPIIQEIFVCVNSIVRTDPEAEVRRAAVMVVTLLLKGLGVDALKVLEDVLLDLYRTLKLVYQRETDEVVKLHVELTLEELNKATMNFMFPKLSLEKKINIFLPHDL